MDKVVKRFALCIALFHAVWADSSQCGHPGQPANVIISEPVELADQEWFPIGTELTFACQESTDKLRGDDKRICLDDGSWTDASPWCESNVIYGKSLKVQDDVTDVLTDGLIRADDENLVDCLDTETESQRTFQLPIVGVDSITSIVIHIEDVPANVALMSIKLDEQDIHCQALDLTVFECTIEFEDNVVLVDGLLTVNSDLPVLSLCELEVYARLSDYKERPIKVSNRTFDFGDDWMYPMDPVDYDYGSSTEQEDTSLQEIVMIFVGLTLGTAVAAVVVAKVYSTYCSKKADPIKEFYTQVPTIIVNGHKELDPQFIQHIHNPKLSV